MAKKKKSKRVEFPDPVKGIDKVHKEVILKVIRETGAIGPALRATGITKQTYQGYVERDPEFADALETSQAVFAGKLQQFALERATGQMKKAILFKGKQVRIKNPKTGKFEDYWESDYADSILLAMLRAHVQDLYKEKTTHEGIIQVKEIKDVSLDDL